MEKKISKKEIAIIIVGSIAYLILWLIQGKNSAAENPQVMAIITQLGQFAQENKVDVSSLMGPLQGLAHSGNGSINGVLAQLQVLITVSLVLTCKKPGYITVIVINVLNMLYTLFYSVLILGRTAALPGIAISFVSIIILSIIYNYIKKNTKMHNDLTESYEQAIESNRIIQEKDEVLTFLAYYDRLTQMPNRHLFIDTIEEKAKTGEEYTIVYAGLNGFRQVNENLGHATGDDLLKTYAARIEELCGDAIFTAKLGSDDFGFILPSGNTSDDIAAFVGQLQELFGEPVDIRGDVISLTGNYGAATFPIDARSAEDLFRCAESAMYSSKDSGTNQLFFYAR